MLLPNDELPHPADIANGANDAASDYSGTDMDMDLTLPPTEDDVREQDRHDFKPPPHIAARFYRPSQARRKGSAASSRRNSISSAHSRCSSIQPSGRCPEGQTKQDAQQLRRKTFLEDRRARLADRAAHVEKVRLRAALVKATPRGQTTSEERALAAQQARERNLAEIVTSCAEEVKKAKQIAEATKERREQELAKMKMQMEERMAEAQKRREDLRAKGLPRRSRGQSLLIAKKPADALPDIKERHVRRMTDEDAATKIQNWWRSCTRDQIIKEFNALDLHVDSIRDKSFDEVIDLLGQEKVLKVTSQLLRICGLREGDPGSVEELVAVRTFLSAFLILGHPTQVLSNKDITNEDATAGNTAHELPMTDLNNPQLQELIGKAKDVLISFENALASLTPGNGYTLPSSMRKTLPEAYAVFYNAFIAWKSRDSNALIEVMLMQFLELDAILKTVNDTADPAVAGLYRESIEEGQIQLIIRIKQLAGKDQGMKLIREARLEAQKSQKSKKRKGDTKPRVAETATGPTADGQASASTQMPTPPSTPAGKPKGKERGDARFGLNSFLPDNRVVVHELAINREYEIPAEDYVAQQAAVYAMLFDRMKQAVIEGDGDNIFNLFLLVAEAIKEKLQRLLLPGNTMYNLVKDTLDSELAQRQYSLGNFSYERFFAFLASLLPKLCAPFRDDEVKNLVHNRLEEDDLVDRLKAVNRFIDLMACDYINYLLRKAAPQLIETGAAYETRRFAEEFGEEGTKLEAAEAAWRTAYDKALADAHKRDLEDHHRGNHHARSRPSGSRIYGQMLVDVFTQPLPLDAARIPEMLRLDESRIKEVSTTIQRIVTVGAVLLQCKNLLKRDVRSPWKTEAARIMAVLEANHESQETTLGGVMAALEAGRSMPTATKSQLRVLVNKVLTASQDMSTNAMEPRERVLSLLLTRLRSNILARLASGSATEKVKATNAAGEKLATLGLSEFVEKVRHVAELLDKVGTVDRQSHCHWWDIVAAKLQQESAQAL